MFPPRQRAHKRLMTAQATISFFSFFFFYTDLTLGVVDAEQLPFSREKAEVLVLRGSLGLSLMQALVRKGCCTWCGAGCTQSLCGHAIPAG